jgi:hypothetical protein
MSVHQAFSLIAMNKGLLRFRRISRAAGAALVLAALCMAPPAAFAADDHDCVDSQSAHDDCGGHNMMLVGVNNAYLSHLPMFDSEHRFQVIFRATFETTSADGKTTNIEKVYTDDRMDHPEIGMYTVNPRHVFVLSRLFDENADPLRTSFVGRVFRGHFERPGRELIDGLDGVDVGISRMIYARELEPDGEKSEELRYILFGDGEELFLAHEITRPPDFDQIVAVDVDGHGFTADDLERGVVVDVPGRENTAETRLRVEESVEAMADVTGAGKPTKLRIHVVAEPYFEEGELLAEFTFDPTPLEIEAGFGD